MTNDHEDLSVKLRRSAAWRARHKVGAAPGHVSAADMEEAADLIDRQAADIARLGRVVHTPDPDWTTRGEVPCAYPSCGCDPDAICHVACNEAQSAAAFSTSQSALAKAEGERDEYRTLVIEAGREGGGFMTDTVSLTFLKGVPAQVKAFVASLRARAQSAEARAEKLLATLKLIAGQTPHNANSKADPDREHYLRSVLISLAANAIEALSPPLGRGGKGIGFVTSPVEPGSGALPSSGGWQPIETAPKDSSAILITRPTDFESEEGWHVVRWFDDCWTCHDGKFDTPLRGPSPTHWQPLPSPPSITKETGA